MGRKIMKTGGAGSWRVADGVPVTAPSRQCLSMILCSMLLWTSGQAAEPKLAPFFSKHCIECHDAETKKGNLDLTSLPPAASGTENFARWVKVHDRVVSGEMPPKKKARPALAEVKAITRSLSDTLIAAERTRLAAEPRTGVRRLTRAEYENTVRDLFALPGIRLQDLLPADGSAHGFDKNSDALDISHVNLAKYVEAADHALNVAIATQPAAPKSETALLSLAGNSLPNLMVLQGDAVLLRDKKLDPVVPPAGVYAHVGHGQHEQLGLFSRMSSYGVFRHEDESWNPYFQTFATLYPGRYKVRASFWSMTWDQGKILPSRGVEAARLSIVQFNENGRGGGHPSSVLGYYAAPSIDSQVHEMDVWLNYKESFGFNTASLAPVVLYRVGTWGQKDRTMGFTGPCIVNDWVEVDGPLHDVWPPRSHRLLFGEMPLTEFKAAEQKDVRPPTRKPLRQEIIGARNRPEQVAGIWTPQTTQPLVDADRLLAGFLPKAFRRPVTEGVRKEYVAKVEARLQAGDCFETAMRWACRAALCSPDFLYLVETSKGDTLVPKPQAKANTPAKPGTGDKSVPVTDHALAARLSYFLWNSMPDDTLLALAAKGTLSQPKMLREQVERLLKDKKSERFVEDFLGQWLKLRAIAANDPDKKLYPEFSPYLQDSMVAETRAYFRELLEKNLPAKHLVKSDFAMLNEKLATHYGIKGVSGPEIRRVKLPPGSPRGGFLTQAAILKITANGTTTSPVPRGAFVMARLLGQEPEPPPANVAAVEPDVRGTTTIRDQLAKHRDNASCASCHAKMDPPGFALESFDVIGGLRERYRSIGDGEAAPRGSIDPRIGISFKLGPKVDASGELADGRKFGDIAEFQTLLASSPRPLLLNLAQQLTIYSTGRPLAFSDRASLDDLVVRVEKQGGGIRTLIHELVQSRLFQTR
ncbi:MAG: DUF1592 domain-containing protein [Limisphaerales bacterium]